MPENRRMAIEVLGNLRSNRAIPIFKGLLESEEDIYVLLDVLKALAAINTDEARVLLQNASHHSFSPVRRLASELAQTTPANSREEHENTIKSI